MSTLLFLKRAGIGLAAFLVAISLVTPARADTGLGQLHFTFVAVSDAGTIVGVNHRIAMNGDGKFGNGHVQGGGTFVHFDNAPAGTPKPIVAFGRWKAKKFVSFSGVIGSYGPIGASILVMEVELHAVFPAPAVVPATLTIICNIGPAGITTGLPEGYQLSVPSTGLLFVPLVPAAGLTHIGLAGI